MNRNSRQQLIQLALVIVSFIIGWFSHQFLQPFFNHHVVSQPGQVLDDQVVIYKAPDTAEHRQQPMRINQVKVLQQSPDALLLELSYHFSAPIPANEVKIYVGLFSKFLYLGDGGVQQGDGTVRMRLSIIDSRMQEAGIESFRTESMQISFEHYAPDGYKGVLASTVLPYTKAWAHAK